MAVLTIKHYNDIIQSFIDNVGDSSRSYYVWVGHPDAWPDDNNPPAANASIGEYELTTYDHIVYGKKINQSDISFVVPRYDWANNTAYDRYDQDDGDLYSKQFYVRTSDGHVFKCIDNNNNANSTVKPSLTSTTGTFNTADGYTWKYLYTVETSANTKFTTTNYIPITANTDVKNNAIDGTIDVIRLTAGGNNYQTYSNGYLRAFVNNYVVQLPNTASSFTNFYKDSAIYLIDGYGSGQIRTISNYNGLTKNITVSEPFETKAQLELTDVNNGTAIVDGVLAWQQFEKTSLSYIQNSFSGGDIVKQSDTGANGYVASANSTVIRVVTTSNEAFELQYPIHVVAYSGTTKSGTVDIISGNNWVIANSGTAFTTDYSADQYIQVGANTATNIRRIMSVNTTVLVCNVAFTANANGQSHALLPYTAVPTSITVQKANGVVTDTNLTGVTLTISNLQSTGVSYIVGEKVTMVDQYDVDQGAVGTVNYANTTTLILSDVTGTFTASLYTKGGSSLQKATIDDIGANPTVTIDSPQGQFLAGQTVYFKNAANLQVTYANATLFSYYFTPNELTEYVISPQVTITGDGANALAYSIVNATSNSIQSIVVLNPGTEYTYANITITANSLYGSGAEAEPTISPINGHGYDIDQELGARYASISVLFDDIDTELLKFPGYGQYRIVGILKDPLFEELTINLDTFDRIKLTLANKQGAFEVGEIVLQPSTDTTLSEQTFTANTTKVNNTAETITITDANTIFAVGSRVFYRVPSGNTAVSNLTANTHYYVSFANSTVIALSSTLGGANVNLTAGTSNPGETHTLVPETSNATIFSSFSGGATAAGVCVYSNSTFLELKNVKGTFVANQSLDKVYGFTSGATANVTVANIAYFSILGSNVQSVSETTSGGVGELETINSNTQVVLTNVSGDFQINDLLVDAQTNTYANVASLYVANGTIDVSSTFGQRFVQTARLPLSSNTGPFTQFERITQSVTNATAIVMDTTHEVDMHYTNLAGGSFSQGGYLESATANGYILYANSTYLRVTAVEGSFTAGGQAINSGAVTADTGNVYSVLVLSDVDGTNRFQAANTIVGEDSGAVGTPSSYANTIFYPDLVRESGSVVYLENIEPFERTVDSKERINIVIKF